MLALLFALGGTPPPCFPAELGQIDPPSAVSQPVTPPPGPITAPPPLGLHNARPAAPPAAAPGSPLTQEERAQYRIAFGILGQMGELSLAMSPPVQRGGAVTLQGQVKASIFGIGETEKRIVSEFDPASLGARAWTSVRNSGGKMVTDFARQTQPGTVALVRRRPGKPDQPETLQRRAAVLDPLAFIMRVRVDPPRAPQVFEVLDGHGLWLLTVAPATRTTSDLGRVLRIDGKADPVFWDGSHDGERPNRTFTFWLSDDAFHTPLRLVMPLAMGEVRADLVTVTRSHPRPPMGSVPPAPAASPRPAVADGERASGWLGAVRRAIQLPK
jgi:hypothetical protein